MQKKLRLVCMLLAIMLITLPQKIFSQNTKSQELKQYMGTANANKIAPVGNYIFRFEKGSFPRKVNTPDQTFIQVMIGGTQDVSAGNLNEVVYLGKTLPRNYAPYGRSAVVKEKNSNSHSEVPNTAKEDPRIVQLQQQVQQLQQQIQSGGNNNNNTRTVATQTDNIAPGHSVQDSIMSLLGLDDLQKKELLLNAKFLEELNNAAGDTTVRNSYEKARKLRTWISSSGELLDRMSRPWIVTFLYGFLNGIGKILAVILALAITMVLFGSNSLSEFFLRKAWGRNIIANITDFFKTLTALIMFIVIFIVWLFIFIYDRAWEWTWSEIFWISLGFIVVAYIITNMLDPASRGKWYSFHRARLPSGKHEIHNDH